jgi:hypothetical protein
LGKEIQTGNLHPLLKVTFFKYRWDSNSEKFYYKWAFPKCQLTNLWNLVFSILMLCFNHNNIPQETLMIHFSFPIQQNLKSTIKIIGIKYNKYLKFNWKVKNIHEKGDKESLGWRVKY